MVSGITILISLPIIGWAADRIPAVLVIIVSFFIRGSLFGIIYYATEPKSWKIRTLVPMIFLFTMLQ